MTRDEIARYQLKGFYRLWHQWRNAPQAWMRRNALKAKTLGLVYHDRTLTRED